MVNPNGLYDLFVDLLRDLFSFETQVVEKFPHFIEKASNTTLKKSFEEHFALSQIHLERLQNIFKILNENPQGRECPSAKVLLDQAENGLKSDWSLATQDAYLIVVSQKIEHCEISGYGSARTIARHLSNINKNKSIDYDEIADWLQESLDEECSSDEKLTDIAEGGFFTTGINELAEQECALSK